MNAQKVITLIESYKEASKSIIAHYDGLKETHWVIKDLEADIVAEVSEHYKEKWFKCHTGIALLLSNGSHHITLFSVPVQIQETVSFVK